MKRLHLFLIKSFIVPFITAFFVAIFLLLMQFLWKYIDDLVGKGLEVNQIAQLLFYASARFVPLAIPIAMLISSIMMFGKLAENHELNALKSSGISFIRILFPLSILVIIISFGSFLFSNYIMPIANLKNGTMIYDIQKKKPALNIKEGIFYKNIEGYSIKIGKKESNGKILKNIIIYDHTSKKGNDKVIVAEKGLMQITRNEKILELILYNGHSYIDNYNNKKKKFQITSFKKDLIRFDLSSFSEINNSENLYKGHYAMLNNTQLKVAIDSLENILLTKKEDFKKTINNNYQKDIITKTNIIQKDTSIALSVKDYDVAINKTRNLKLIAKGKKDELNYKKLIITKHKIEWHRKISLAVACIIMFFIGAPLGSLIKQGGIGLPILVSIIFFVAYHVISIIGEKAAKELTISAAEGMWVANILFFPIAFILILRAKNDPKIFNISRLKVSIFDHK